LTTHRRTIVARILSSVHALLAVMALLLTAPVLATEDAAITACARMTLDGRTMAYAPDVDPALPPAAASHADFSPLPAERAGFGIGGGKVWLRLIVDAGACAEPLFLELGNPFVNRVIVHRQAADGWRLHWDSDQTASGARPGRLRHQVVPLTPERRSTYLIELRGPGALAVAPALVAGSDLADSASTRTAVTGAMLGGIVALSAYLVCLALILRVRGLLAFTASALSLGAFYAFASGTADPLLVALSDDIAGAREMALRANGFAVLVSACSHWLYARALLATATGRWTRALPYATLLPALALAAAFPFLPGRIVSLACMVMGAAATVAFLREGLAARRAGHPLANAAMFAFAVVAVAALGYIGGYVGLLPWSPWQLDALAAGVWVEATMLSMAVGAHVKELRGREEALAARTEELSLLSRLDPMTGLGNRRAFDAVVPAEIERCARRDREAVMLVVDIDHFKRVNDAWGHAFGDSVIRMLGAAIANSVRAADFSYRYGGEEFVVLLPGLGADNGRIVAERIMREFTNCSPTAPDGSRPFFSVSIGLATLHRGDSADTLFARADAAMYRAKQGGRCRIETAESGADDPRNALAAQEAPAPLPGAAAASTDEPAPVAAPEARRADAGTVGLAA